jgi:hypothetical protein
LLLNYWLHLFITLFPKIKLTNLFTSDPSFMHKKYEDFLSYMKNQHSTSFKHLFIKHQRKRLLDRLLLIRDDEQKILDTLREERARAIFIKQNYCIENVHTKDGIVFA